MNIAKMMTPKIFTIFINENCTVRQGLEMFKKHGYTAIPVLDDNGRYVGCATEGDLLRIMIREGTTDMRHYEKFKIAEIVRKDFLPPLGIDADYNTVISSVLNQNFVPIIDGRGALCGILTRKSVINWLSEKYNELRT